MPAEYQRNGGHYQQCQHLQADAVRANILAVLGYHVLRVVPQTMRTLGGVALLARQIAFFLDTKLEPTTPLQDLRRRKLYLELMPQVRS